MQMFTGFGIPELSNYLLFDSYVLLITCGFWFFSGSIWVFECGLDTGSMYLRRLHGCSTSSLEYVKICGPGKEKAICGVAETTFMLIHASV